MSRSGYYDDHPNWLYRGAVDSALQGRRGQQFLRELATALDAMPVPRLISNDLRKDGEVCALGCVGAQRGIELEKLDPEDWYSLADTFNIAESMVREVEYINDECYWVDDTPEKRWQRVRMWVNEHLRSDA